MKSGPRENHRNIIDSKKKVEKKRNFFFTFLAMNHLKPGGRERWTMSGGGRDLTMACRGATESPVARDNKLLC